MLDKIGKNDSSRKEKHIYFVISSASAACSGPAAELLGSAARVVLVSLESTLVTLVRSPSVGTA
jgi:hypothetical protein